MTDEKTKERRDEFIISAAEYLRAASTQLMDANGMLINHPIESQKCINLINQIVEDHRIEVGAF